MAHVKPLLDADILPMAILAAGGAKHGGDWFVSASFPVSGGLFGGLYHAEFGNSIEDCVEKILAWYETYWGGL